MILNSVDLKILRAFNTLKEEEEISAWEIMKKVYHDGKNKEYMRVLRRLKKMSKYGLFVCNGKCKYMMIMDYVKVKKFKFPDKLCLGVAFKIENKWVVREF